MSGLRDCRKTAKSPIPSLATVAAGEPSSKTAYPGKKTGVRSLRSVMHYIGHLIHAYGLFTLAVIVGLECVGLPLPGETALLAAAIYAGTKHDLNIVSVILTTAGSAIIGRMIGYVIGHEYGYWVCCVTAVMCA